MPIDPKTFRHVLGHYPTGLSVITAAAADGRRTGMVVGSFTSVSLDPPLVAFFPDKRSTSWPRIQATRRFCVNVLASNQQDVCRRFAVSGGDKFDGLTHRTSVNGSPVLDGVIAWIDCDLHAVQEAGDHFFVLGLVRALEVEITGSPLLFFQGAYGRFASVA